MQTHRKKHKLARLDMQPAAGAQQGFVEWDDTSFMSSSAGSAAVRKCQKGRRDGTLAVDCTQVQSWGS